MTTHRRIPLLDNWNCTPLYVCIFFFFFFFLFGIDGLNRVTKYNNPFLSPSRDTHSQHTVHTEWMKEKKRKEKKKNPKTNMPTTRRAIVSAATYTSLSVGANKYVNINSFFLCVCVCSIWYLCMLPTFTIHKWPTYSLNEHVSRSQMTGHIRWLLIPLCSYPTS